MEQIDPVMLARNLRRARKGAGLTQIQLAEVADKSPSTVSVLESGKVTRPHLGTILDLADALHVEPEDLTGDATGPKAGAPTSSHRFGGRRAIDLPVDDFRRVLAEARGEDDDTGLISLYETLDDERTLAELKYRADEGDRKARVEYARAVERRMVVYLALVGLGANPPDPEELTREVMQLEELEPIR